MSWEIFCKLPNVKLTNTDDTLRCANDSTLETMEVEINGRCHTVTFTIVKQMTPEVIGGIGLLKLFGIELSNRNTF